MNVLAGTCYGVPADEFWDLKRMHAPDDDVLNLSRGFLDILWNHQRLKRLPVYGPILKAMPRDWNWS